MKLIFALSFLFILWGCGNDDHTPAAVVKTDTVSQEKLLTDALKLYPDSVDLIEDLSEIYTDREKYDSALALIQHAMKKDSINPELWKVRSLILTAKGDTAEAIRSLETAISIHPDPKYLSMAGALMAETKNIAALGIGQTLAASNNERSQLEGNYIQGLYYSYTDQKMKAIPFFDKAIATEYTFMQGYLEKGLALYDLGKYSEAAAVFQKAVTVQNNFEQGYYFLGQCYEKLNRKEDAANAYRKALLYDPNYEEASDALDNLKM